MIPHHHAVSKPFKYAPTHSKTTLSDGIYFMKFPKNKTVYILSLTYDILLNFTQEKPLFTIVTATEKSL